MPDLSRTIRSRLIFACAFLLLVIPPFAGAAPADFPRPPGIEPQIEFWREIFTQYSVYEDVLHDAEYPWKIIKVLDFRPLAASGVSEGELERTIITRERREKILIDHMFEQLNLARNNPQSLNPEEQRVWRLYSDLKRPDKFLAARGRIRGQRGLREKFIQAISISGRYMPHMERIFAQAGLPIELTRLPFVESSFNLAAYSKVGAAGIWQFIPSSARMYMRLDDVVDDRRDPLFSTEAAAALLRDNYAALQSWPLAVTAYNHGREGMVHAIRQVGSRNIVEIIRRYNSSSFGFASKNFYTSFLAAVDVERDHLKYFGAQPMEPPLNYQYVRIHDYVPYSTLQRLSGLNAEGFRLLNPAYNDSVVEGRLWVPPLHRIRVPAGRAQPFAAAYARLGTNERFSGQRQYYSYHRVRPGQSLGGIARMYGSSVSVIREANGLTAKSRIRVGQLLRIPPHARPALAAMTPPVSAPAPVARPITPVAHATPSTQVTANALIAVAPSSPAPTSTAPARTTLMAVPVAPAPAVASSAQAVVVQPTVSPKTPAIQKSVPPKPVAEKNVLGRHRVVSGDSLDRIARHNHCSIQAIIDANSLKDGRHLKIGQVLVIPAN